MKISTTADWRVQFTGLYRCSEYKVTQNAMQQKRKTQLTHLTFITNYLQQNYSTSVHANGIHIHVCINISCKSCLSIVVKWKISFRLLESDSSPNVFPVIYIERILISKYLFWIILRKYNMHKIVMKNIVGNSTQ